MRCRRAFEIDLGAFLVEPKSAAWDDFRAHYPRCPECAAEVRTWTELTTTLDGGHPDPETLLRFQDTPATLDPTERRRVATHVAACATCADELRALRGMAAVIPARAPERGRAPAPARRRPSFLGGLGRLAWHPAVAYALLVVTAVPLLLARRHEIGAIPAKEAPLVAKPPAASQARPEGQLAMGGAAKGEARREDRASGDAAVAERDEPAPEAKRKALPLVPVSPAPPAPAQAQVPAAPAPPTLPARELASPRARLADEESRAPGDIAAATSSRTVQLSRQGATVTIAVPRPANLRDVRTVDVRVVDVERGRELRERVPVEPDRPLTLSVPDVWLGPGSYRLEVHAGERVDVTPFAVR